MPATANAVPLRLRRLSDLAELPSYQSRHAAGLDLHAAIAEPITLAPGDIVTIEVPRIGKLVNPAVVV